jgi:hypothetical protein
MNLIFDNLVFRASLAHICMPPASKPVWTSHFIHDHQAKHKYKLQSTLCKLICHGIHICLRNRRPCSERENFCFNLPSSTRDWRLQSYFGNRTRRFNTTNTKVCHSKRSRASSRHVSPSYPTSLRSISMCRPIFSLYSKWSLQQNSVFIVLPSGLLSSHPALQISYPGNAN